MKKVLILLLTVILFLNLAFAQEGQSEAQTKEIPNIGTVSYIGDVEVIEDQSGLTTIKVVGEADMSVLGREINNVKNIELRAANNEIEYAKFVALEDGTYNFVYNNQEYVFNVKKGGEIVFDPKQKTIFGKDAELDINEQKISGADFQIKLSDLGDVNEIRFNSEGKYNYGNYAISSKESFSVFTDGRNVENFEGNAFSLNKEGYSAKGKISVTGKLNYNGLESETFTEFSEERALFDVKIGDAEINNNKHTIRVEDGRVLLKNENILSDADAETFIVKTSKDGENFWSLLDEENNQLSIHTIKEGDLTTLNVVPLSSYENSLIARLKTNPSEAIKDAEAYLEKLKTEGSVSQKEIDSVELAIIEAKNLQSNSITEFGTSRDRLLEFMERENLDPELKSYASLSLGELYEEQAKTNDFYDQAKKPSELFKEAEKFYLQAKTNPELFEDANLKLAQMHINLGQTYSDPKEFEKADNVYEDLINLGSNSPEDQAKFYIGKATSKLYEGDIRSALLYSDKSIELNPQSDMAVNFHKQLQFATLDTISKGLNSQSDELYSSLNEKLGIDTQSSDVKNVFSKTFGDSLRFFTDPVTGRAGKLVGEFEGKEVAIENQQAGIIAMKYMLKEGHNLEEIAQLSFDERKKVISRTMGFDAQRDAQVIDNFAYSTLNAQGNPDVALAMANGNAGRAREILSDGGYDSKVIGDDFYFKTGQGYVDPGNLRVTFKDNLLDGIDIKNALLFLGPTIPLSVGSRTVTLAGLGESAVSKIPGVIEARTTIGGMKALQTFSAKFPKSFIMADLATSTVVQTGVSITADQILPGSGQYIDVLTGNAITGRIGHTVSSGAKKADSKFVAPSLRRIFFTEDGEVYHGMEFARQQDLDLFKKELEARVTKIGDPDLARVGINAYSLGDDQRFFLYVNPDAEVDRVADNLLQKGFTDQFFGREVIAYDNEVWLGQIIEKDASNTMGAYVPLLDKIVINRPLMERLYPDPTLRQEILKEVIMHETFHAEFAKMPYSQQEAVYNLFKINPRFPEYKRIFLERNPGYSSLSDERIINELIAHAGERKFRESVGCVTGATCQVYDDMLRSIESDFIIDTNIPKNVAGTKVASSPKTSTVLQATRQRVEDIVRESDLVIPKSQSTVTIGIGSSKRVISSAEYFERRTNELFADGNDVWVSRWELAGLETAFKKRGITIARGPESHLGGVTGPTIPHLNVYGDNIYGNKVSKHLFITDDPYDSRIKSLSRGFQSKIYTPEHPRFY